jgi:hypothetical protein
MTHVSIASKFQCWQERGERATNDIDKILLKTHKNAQKQHLLTWYCVLRFAHQARSGSAIVYYNLIFMRRKSYKNSLVNVGLFWQSYSTFFAAALLGAQLNRFRLLWQLTLKSVYTSDLYAHDIISMSYNRLLCQTILSSNYWTNLPLGCV